MSRATSTTAVDHTLPVLPFIHPSKSHPASEIRLDEAIKAVTSQSVAHALVESDPHREKWSSRWTFLIACVSSAVGMGNLWRFPFLAYRHGAGAFFIPYLLALFLVGIPMLLLEFAVGQIFQNGSPKSYHRLHRRLTGLGLASPASALVISMYYSLIIVWAIFYFINSFRPTLPWALDLTQSCVGDVCQKPDILKNAKNFFHGSANVAMSPEGTVTSNGIATLSLPIVAIMIGLWVLNFLAIRWGTKVLGKILVVTMVLPTILLAILLGVGLSREGASDGIYSYLGTWDFTRLKNTNIWTDATGQIIFSIGLSIGVMTAYASHNAANQNVAMNAAVVAVSNSVFSFFCGLIVFSFAGSLAYTAGVKQEDLKMDGPTLAFMTYPTGVSTLPAPWAQIVCLLFFATLTLLGFDTLVSLTVSAASVLSDSKLSRRLSYSAIVGSITIFSTAMAILLYAPNYGLYVLDTVDNYVNSVCLLSITMGQAIAVAWVQGFSTTAEYVGKASQVVLSSMLFGSFFIFTIVLNAAPGSGGTVAAIVVLVVGVVLGFVVSAILAVLYQAPGPGMATNEIHHAQQQPLSTKDKLWWLYIGGIELFRHDVNTLTAAPGSLWRAPLLWSILVKFLIPFTLEFMVVDFLCHKERFYGNAPWGYIFIGVLLNASIVILVIVGCVWPSAYQALVEEDVQEDIRSGEKTETGSDVGEFGNLNRTGA